MTRAEWYARHGTTPPLPPLLPQAHLWVEMEPMVELMLTTLRVSFFSRRGSNACVTLRGPTAFTFRTFRYSAGSLQADGS